MTLHKRVNGGKGERAACAYYRHGIIMPQVRYLQDKQMVAISEQDY